MNITFLIGNGFDLKLGLNTRYTDMYDSYICSPSSNKVIEHFKRILQSDAPNKYPNWSDFEMAMAKCASNFSSETDFICCVRDFKNHMCTHLLDEQNHFSNILKKNHDNWLICVHEVERSLSEFYKGQIPNVVYQIDSLIKDSNIRYNIINFNYTTTFDKLCMSSPSNIIHIHGSLDSDIALGADNLKQFGKLPFSITNKLERAFVKPLYNESYDIHRYNKAKLLIENSDVICIYGMSLGLSDKTWTDTLANWLLSNEKSHLIYYQYSDNTFVNWNGDAKIEAEEVRKDELLNRIYPSQSDICKVYNRVHIPVGYDIFNIPQKLKNSSTMKVVQSNILPISASY